jgi:hypothetical protein
VFFVGMKAYRIVDWDDNFENNRTRILKNLDWIPFPNKHDGDGFTELLDHKNGMAHYGAWCLIAQVASKCHPRGTLMRDGERPYDVTTLARVTRGRREIFEEAIPRLIFIGWIEEFDFVSSCNSIDMALGGTQVPDNDTNPALRCAQLTIEGKGREGKGTEGNGMEGKPNSARQSDEEFMESLKTNPAYEGIDVVREFQKMLSWCSVNRKQPNHKRFVNWLNKADRPMNLNFPQDTRRTEKAANEFPEPHLKAKLL